MGNGFELKEKNSDLRTEEKEKKKGGREKEDQKRESLGKGKV